MAKERTKELLARAIAPFPERNRRRWPRPRRQRSRCSPRNQLRRPKEPQHCGPPHDYEDPAPAEEDTVEPEEFLRKET